MHLNTSYDQIIYRTLPRRETHPSHLAAIASLFGIAGAPTAHCTVLELGCGTGDNLIPMAAEYPDSSFVGIDLSSVQICEGNQVIADLALKNITLKVESINEFCRGAKTFDYIICHGVFSWVDRNIQNQILKIFAEHLSDQGIAYLSYNVLPGWRMQGALREMMQYHTAAIEDPHEKVEQAKALLHFLSESKIDVGGTYGKFIDESFKELKKAPDYYLFHEYLEKTNEAFYFHQVAERIDKHGLAYIGDAHFGLMSTADIAPEANRVLEELKSDRVRYEQYLDFLRNRKLRESILCKQNRVPLYPANSSAIENSFCAAPLTPRSAILNIANNQQEVFSHLNGGEIRNDSPIVKAALVTLAEAWPESRAFSDILLHACRVTQVDLHSEHGALAKSELVKEFSTFISANLMELSSGAALCSRVISETPLASSLARYQSTRQESVTSLRHRAVKLESVTRQVLALLDGSRSLQDLKVELAKLHSRGELVVKAQQTTRSEDFLDKTFEQLIQQVLEVLARQGFLKK